jgi:hypothetical protein
MVNATWIVNANGAVHGTHQDLFSQFAGDTFEALSDTVSLFDTAKPSKLEII